MRLVCLVENTAVDERFGAEHGLSLYLEIAHRRVLFDMGQTALFSQNAATAHLSLAAVDTAIVSHGHYDHGGGLSTFLSHNTHAPIYIQREAFTPHYNGDKYIGLDRSLAAHARIRFTDGIHPLGDGITLYANASAIGQLAHGSAGLSTEQDGERIPDDFRHEQYLLIEENGKRVLISGCSHRGILEITEQFRPDVLIGGFHLSKLPPTQAVAEYADTLNTYPTVFHTCHCTGVPQYQALQKAMPRLYYLASGQELIL